MKGESITLKSRVASDKNTIEHNEEHKGYRKQGCCFWVQGDTHVFHRRRPSAALFLITMGICIVFSLDATLVCWAIHFSFIEGGHLLFNNPWVLHCVLVGCYSWLQGDTLVFHWGWPSATLFLISLGFCIVCSPDARLDFMVILLSFIEGGLRPPYF